jgi:PhoH-like ATPase
MSSNAELRKIFVVDTSLMIHDPDAFLRFKDNIIVIPFVVLEELDKKKRDGSGAAGSARHAIRNLDHLRTKGSLVAGVPTPGGGLLLVDMKTYLPKGIRLDMSINDNAIIGTALRWHHRTDITREDSSERNFFSHFDERLGEVTLISKDINLRVKSEACGLRAEDYQTDRLVASENDLYTGIVRIGVNEDQLGQIEAAFYEGSMNPLGSPLKQEYVDALISLPSLLPNACCIFIGDERDGHEVLALYKVSEDGKAQFHPVPFPKVPRGGGKKIQPRNIGQAFAYFMLSDPTISLVTLSGIAGSGKTLMALAAGLEQTLPERGKGWYRQIIVCRPTQEIGNQIGYLKGTLADKMSPWAKPIVDALELIANGREMEAYETVSPKKFTLDDLLGESANSPVKVEPANFMQGRSLHHRLLLIDETQNYRPGDMKKLITRCGKGSKAVLVGDVDQVESPYLDAVSNGLSYVIERFKGQTTFGHVALWESERSPLAELAAKLL